MKNPFTSKVKSKCCHSNVVSGGVEYTPDSYIIYYSCSNCGRECDIVVVNRKEKK
jgi:hypothetical protein